MLRCQSASLRGGGGSSSREPGNFSRIKAFRIDAANFDRPHELMLGRVLALLKQMLPGRDARPMRNHFADFASAYNLAKRPKTLRPHILGIGLPCLDKAGRNNSPSTRSSKRQHLVQTFSQHPIQAAEVQLSGCCIWATLA